MKIVESPTPLTIDMDDVIGVNEWRMSSETLSTEGAQQCMIITARNSVTGIAQMGHFTDINPLIPGADRDAQTEFGLFIDNIPSIGPAKATELMTDSGTNHPDGEYYEWADLDRDYVESAVGLLVARRVIMKRSVTISWQADGTTDAQLDCASGIYTRYSRPNGTIPVTPLSASALYS